MRASERLGVRLKVFLAGRGWPSRAVRYRGKGADGANEQAPRTARTPRHRQRELPAPDSRLFFELTFVVPAPEGTRLPALPLHEGVVIGSRHVGLRRTDKVREAASAVARTPQSGACEGRGEEEGNGARRRSGACTPRRGSRRLYAIGFAFASAAAVGSGALPLWLSLLIVAGLILLSRGNRWTPGRSIREEGLSSPARASDRGGGAHGRGASEPCLSEPPRRSARRSILNGSASTTISRRFDPRSDGCRTACGRRSNCRRARDVAEGVARGRHVGLEARQVTRRPSCRVRCGRSTWRNGVLRGKPEAWRLVWSRRPGALSFQTIGARLSSRSPSRTPLSSPRAPTRSQTGCSEPITRADDTITRCARPWLPAAISAGSPQGPRHVAYSRPASARRLRPHASACRTNPSSASSSCRTATSARSSRSRGRCPCARPRSASSGSRAIRRTRRPPAGARRARDVPTAAPLRSSRTSSSPRAPATEPAHRRTAAA